jgi:hypothetical protein
MDELLQVFPGHGVGPGHLCPPVFLREQLTHVIEDSSLLSMIGVTKDERRSLETYCKAIDRRPSWVDKWREVCVTADWGPDNFGLRKGNDEELVTFDWGSTRLAPMEEDLAVLLMRLKDVAERTRGELVSYYLQVYANETGHSIDYEQFRSRIPWARFLVTLRYLVGHVNALQWFPHQTRSREFIRLFINVCHRYLEECLTNE